jgi:cytochrome c553
VNVPAAQAKRAATAALFALLATAAGAQSPERIASCEACHGPDGNSVVPGTPSIAAQPANFLENQLVYFREGLRNAPVMQGIAAGMKDEEIVALAKHFASRKATVVAASPLDEAMAARARTLSRERHCGQCHMPKYEGRAQMPRLAGQREDYLLGTMIAQRDATRTGADTTMTEVLAGLSDADLKALAHYLARVE